MQLPLWSFNIPLRNGEQMKETYVVSLYKYAQYYIGLS